MLGRILEQIGDLLLFAAIALAFGVIKAFSAPEPQNWKEMIISLFTSLLVGTLAGAMALSYGAGDYLAIFITAISSLLSRDIVMAILNNRKNLNALVRRAAFNLVDKFTGANPWSNYDDNDSGHGKSL